MNYLFALTENFEKEVMLEGKTKTVLVPAGFLTDFASVPEALWFWISPFGKYQEAALRKLLNSRDFSREMKAINN